MKPFLFLDVDGTLLPENEVNADHFATVERIITVPASTKTVIGFTITKNARQFPIEEEICWRQTVHNFLLKMEQVTEIVWLTGWKENTNVLEKVFGLTSHQWLQWETSTTEAGKIVALNQFLTQHPAHPFIWVDDFAIPQNPELVLTLPPGLLITPPAETGITDEQVTQMEDFLLTCS